MLLGGDGPSPQGSSWPRRISENSIAARPKLEARWVRRGSSGSDLDGCIRGSCKQTQAQSARGVFWSQTRTVTEHRLSINLDNVHQFDTLLSNELDAREARPTENSVTPSPFTARIRNSQIPLATSLSQYKTGERNGLLGLIRIRQDDRVIYD